MTTEFYPQRAGVLSIYGTSVNVWEEDVDEDGIRPVYKSMLVGLRARGFRVQRDPDVVKHWPRLAPWRHVGRAGDLEFHSGVTGRHLELEFFQNVNRPQVHPNPNGGRYESGKFALLPRHMRLQCVAAMCRVLERFAAWGYSLNEDLSSTQPLGRAVLLIAENRLHENDPLGRFNASWKRDRFARGADGWPAFSEYKSWEYRDRDGIELQSGDVRYARINGRLARGTVHPGVNGQWYLVSNGTSLHGRPYYQLQAKDLFRCDRPDLEPRRVIPGQIERLHAEAAKHLKAENYRRLARVSTALARAAGAA